MSPLARSLHPQDLVSWPTEFSCPCTKCPGSRQLCLQHSVIANFPHPFSLCCRPQTFAVCPVCKPFASSHVYCSPQTFNSPFVCCWTDFLFSSPALHCMSSQVSSAPRNVYTPEKGISWSCIICHTACHTQKLSCHLMHYTNLRPVYYFSFSLFLSHRSHLMLYSTKFFTDLPMMTWSVVFNPLHCISQATFHHTWHVITIPGPLCFDHVFSLLAPDLTYHLHPHHRVYLLVDHRVYLLVEPFTHLSRQGNSVYRKPHKSITVSLHNLSDP